ncbi:DNA-O6-methylguanine--protein-cysteine S-methyltransferase/transcriptional regulator Ada [Pandoraea horticolens]|uniref:DNA-O6-methylguanine--protein-cysteine S-methyltransferase/transcriptional regulator Ada n=1 Tax=Pandoraea horticolens TaxID=2508298 RepID=A0A5E4RKG1_9BURK|nr:bifunctional DNA-binding transcriptional regulator/O6-methylguanine-DNA methyltransferase Ada [Pandoraea horticolens]VVD63797.1 DNA-O6-methylguanine--protein-cysteine S-methyltransferase/transcriptional regulator Ada [Pandoraea horticolens]
MRTDQMTAKRPLRPGTATSGSRDAQARAASAPVTPRYATDNAKWAAVVARSKQADGEFFYSVRTTGVYCRPSCGARLARRENVAFHTDRAAAERAGFRPCKRCKPDQDALDARHAALISAACRRIDTAEAPPRLETLAAEASLSPHYFHRLFRAVTGVTPRAYANARRAERVRNALPSAESVTSAFYDAGFNSNGRFYAKADALLGMKPAAFRAGGKAESIRFAVAQCSLGALLVAATSRGLCDISLGDEPEQLVRNLQDRFPKAELVGADAEFEHWVAQVVGFVESPRMGLSLPLDIRGTAFQQRVWQALREVPAGETASYAQIAERIGSPRAVRAVAQACASNKLAVAIPCHRIVRNDGALSGYRWGVERKRALLAHERGESGEASNPDKGEL